MTQQGLGQTLNQAIEAVNVSIETFLGASHMTVAELGAVGVGSTIKLNAEPGELVELRVNGVAIGRGEIVAVGDRFGVRVTDVGP